MTTNGEKQNLRNGSTKHPHVTDQIASIKRRRFRRIKSAPLSDSSNSHGKITDAFKQKPKSVFDHFYPNYWKVGLTLFVYLAAAVGYGDLIPASDLTILLACLFVVLGMLIVALVLSKAAELLVEKQERLLVKALHLNKSIGEAEILKKMKTKSVRNKLIVLVVLLLVFMGAGTGLLISVEDLNFVHAFYCVIGSLTGLGYISTCFSTTGGRVFSLFWILLGTIYVAQLLFTFALLNTERKQRSLVKWVLKRQTTTSDLEAADFDGDGIVVAAEFVVYKLKEMGKISQDDITPIMDQFEVLDFDKTGTLSAADILRSQGSLLPSDVLGTQVSL
ncbi:two-pore potassium channel 1-like isoform X2 [Rutidosis leptorrhynchoides]|uniref:two-pore potassium channel 1-like isoform X2 n=1 Tax=Rutidosis leptorrhynchoides TaxID=125765 RepID=UPI003A98FDEA